MTRSHRPSTRKKRAKESAESAEAAGAERARVRDAAIAAREAAGVRMVYVPPDDALAIIGARTRGQLNRITTNPDVLLALGWTQEQIDALPEES